MKNNIILPVILLIITLFVSCAAGEIVNNNDNNDDNDNNNPIESQNLMPEDFEYLGAFLTPEPNPVDDSRMWEWGGQAMAFNPKVRGDKVRGDRCSDLEFASQIPRIADPVPSEELVKKTEDFTGSLYGAGHDVWNLISEITIAQPVISETKSLAELNMAQTLQPFTDVRGGLFNWIDEMPRVGLELLPPQGDQTTSKLYLCWGQHMQDPHPSHMWCEKDLQNPDPQGEWTVEGLNPYNSNDYLFEIPQEWSELYTPGMRLATGRYRDGGWSGFGPTLAAIGPYNHGNPPPDGQELDSTILIKYADYYEGEPEQWYEMDNYSHADEWSGGAWLTAGDKSAVVFVGTKGIGDTWYGDPNGPCMDCGLPHLRGWWSDQFEAWFLFYSTADLAKVATGQMQPHEIQPYAHLNVDDVLYYIDQEQEKYHLGACAFDRENGLFYVFEPGRDASSGKREASENPRYDTERTLVHVWRIRGDRYAD